MAALKLGRLACLLAVAALAAACAWQPAPTPTLPAPTASVTPPVAPTPTARVDYWPTRGWRAATPEEQGMDSGKLAGMLQVIESQRLDVHSVLVVRNGYVVAETYFGRYQADTRHVLYSCTKSFVSALVGIAIGKGQIAGVKAPVLSLFPSRTFSRVDERKQAMTLEHLLTMTSGLEWQEGDATYGQMVRSRDWLAFMLDRPMVDQPGTRFNYCSGCSYVLSAIVHEQSGVGMLEFARKQLFEPLGISDFQWETDPSGVANGGWGLWMTPRDMAKLGYLYLNGGEWEGRQVVPAEWVRASVERRVDTGDGLGYGYQWWTYPRLGAYLARGRAGQLIFVLPRQATVVVFTSDVPSDAPLFRLIEDYVVPAVRSGAALSSRTLTA